MKKIASVFATVVISAVAFASVASASFIVVPPGGGPHVKVLSSGGSEQTGFFAYDPAFAGGVSVAVGDVTGSSAPEIVTGSGPGMAPRVRVFSFEGQLLSEFNAYVEGFGGGISVAVANLDGAAPGEIVTGPGFGGGPHVRVFDAAGGLRREWMAYDPGFSGGIHVAAGQLGSAFGGGAVVTAPLFGGGPHVRVFDGNGTVQREWMAYAPEFGGGVNVAVASGRVVTGPWSNGGPHVRVFDSNGNVTSEWMAYDPGFQGGVQVAAGTLDLEPAVVTAPGPGGGPHVRVFDVNGAPNGGGFFAYTPSYTGGVNVAVGNNAVVTGAGVPRVVEEVLTPGAVGPGVAGLQQRLLDMGFWLPAVDGRFGSTTTQAVYAFQKANGLPRDGKIGAEDRPALDRGARPSAVSTSGDLVEVDKARQLLFVVRGGRVEWAFNTSTGSGGTYTSGGRTYRSVTPEGRFTFSRQIDGYRESHLGTLYRPKYFTDAGHAIHGSPSIPPYPASHGCVRLSNPAIDFIWAAGLAPLGSQIWVHS
ncbi:MAG TPA: L,D-transpeptidase family protein [Acidimicrobiales bacterium]|nr:L,D-transpeptidase family protein [Acidimicrobiales bacterium]